ncbi:MAG: hypothetical protein RSD82_06835, partial [Comamonas sp.]
MTKSTTLHRSCGWVYMVVTMTTALVARHQPAHIGPALWGHLRLDSSSMRTRTVGRASRVA